MSDSRRVIQLRSYALAFAVALSPAFFQISYSCERGDTFLLSLELEVSGQDQIVNFVTTNRSYAVTTSSSTAILRVVTKDPNSIASYRWFAGGTAIGPSVDVGVAGGEVTVTVPNGQTALYVGVRAPEGAFDNYIIDVDRVVPITVAMTNNVTNDIFILPYILEVLPTSPITASQPFTADLGGTAELTEEFLDWWQVIAPGGVSSMVVDDFKATVQTRGGGATGPDVPLGLDVAALVPGPTRFCTYPPDQVCTADPDCIVPPCNPPVTVVDFPTSADCAPAGLCDSLGKAQQCTDNGFCVTSNLLLPLEPVLGASYMAGDGVSPGQTEALFGWADDPPPVTAVGVPPIDGDGTWNMIPAVYGGGIAGELGMRVQVDVGGPLFIAFEGVMGVDSNGPDGVGVPDDASPTPDSALVSFPVTCPFVCGDGVTDVCEECDDGNNIDGDGCEADCTLPPSSCNFATTGSDATPQTQTVNVACTWNVTPSQIVFPWELSVSVPTAIIGGGMFTADFGGQAAFSEFFLDVLQAVVPGGAATMEIVDLAATVQIRSGATATGPDVVLGIDPAAVVPGLTSFCTFPNTTVCTVDGDCVVPPCLPPVLLADVPNSTDCSPGGVCDMLGKNALQCLPNGFCVLSEDLFMPLMADSGTFTADASGEVLFGWADQGVPDLTLCPAAVPNCTDLWMPDGSYDLPAAVFSNPTGPIGIRTDTAGLFLAYQCAMGEPGGICSATVQGCLSDADCPGGEACIGLGTDNGVVMPTPDANLISCPIN